MPILDPAEPFQNPPAWRPTPQSLIVPSASVSSESGEPRKVVVTDIRMPVSSMCVFMIKWAIAAIPAAIILFFIVGIIGALFGGVFRAILR